MQVAVWLARAHTQDKHCIHLYTPTHVKGYISRCWCLPRTLWYLPDVVSGAVKLCIMIFLQLSLEDTVEHQISTNLFRKAGESY